MALRFSFCRSLRTWASPALRPPQDDALIEEFLLPID
jgi:hypothetical protein